MAIPKIIHYCWLSGEPYPELVQKCMKSWHAYLPDYEFILWNKEKVSKEIQNSWVESAMAAKKWAFAADYIRLYALYNYGGIYLDTDVEVLKSFEPLLYRSSFIGRESSMDVVEAAVVGSEAKDVWVLRILRCYEGKIFSIDEINNPKIAIPFIIKEQLKNDESVEILPSEYFSPKNQRTGKICITKNSYTVHHFNGGWFTDYQREYFRIRQSYSVKYGKFIGLIVATLFSIVHKIQAKVFH